MEAIRSRAVFEKLFAAETYLAIAKNIVVSLAKKQQCYNKFKMMQNVKTVNTCLDWQKPSQAK